MSSSSSTLSIYSKRKESQAINKSNKSIVKKIGFNKNKSMNDILQSRNNIKYLS